MWRRQRQIINKKRLTRVRNRTILIAAGVQNHIIVNDIRNFVFDLAEASVYGFYKSWKQKFVMSFIIVYEEDGYGILYQCADAAV